MGLDMHEVSRLLAARIQQLAPALIGNQPSTKARLEWRFGNKGSLAVVIAGADRGCWFDHEAGVGGDALDLVRHVRGGLLRDSWQWALAWLGEREMSPPPPAAAAAKTNRAPENPDLWKAIWRESIAARGSPAETYLQFRGVNLPPLAPLKFHPACPRKNPAAPYELQRFPAMLAMMTEPITGIACGIHRTFLRPNGRGKADVSPAKMMLGNAGVIRLVPDYEVTCGLGITEGIENALAVMQRAGWSPVWAAGSAGNIAKFPVLRGIESLTIFADADDKPRKDGTHAGITAARTCGERWAASGREAIIQKPPAGTDWLDAFGRAA